MVHDYNDRLDLKPIDGRDTDTIWKTDINIMSTILKAYPASNLKAHQFDMKSYKLLSILKSIVQ